MSEAEAGVGAGRWRWSLLGGGIALVVGGLALLAAGPLLYRTGVVNLDVARVALPHWGGGMAASALLPAAVALVLSLIGKSSRGVIAAILVIIPALLIGFRMVGAQVQRDGLPPIHDAQTDWARPVAFTGRALGQREAEGAAPVRDDARIPGDAGGEWAGMSFAEAQDAFWDIAPLQLDMEPAAATVLADEIARANGWSVMFSDPPGGQIEAVVRSFWYGLPSDVAVRIVAEDGGARVDVRSTSRIGGGDMGANAQRIKVFLDDLAQAAAVRAATAG